MTQTQTTESEQPVDVRDLLEDMVCAMVDMPDKAEFDWHETQSMVVCEINVANDDVGKLLGRDGAHVRAFRTLFGAVYGKLGKRLHLHVTDPRR